MSVVALRHLLDRLSGSVDQVLVLHDLDASGFSIFGTLGTNSRRYQFKNRVPIIDIGLRLTEVENMGLQSEYYDPVGKGQWEPKRATLERHGATEEEIMFLRNKRVELNAMTSPQFVDFVSRKLEEHGVRKVVPDQNMMKQHALRIIEQQVAEKFLADNLDDLTAAAAETAIPDDLDERVRKLLADEPTLSWDRAVHTILSA